jgi:hypothetical protein
MLMENDGELSLHWVTVYPGQVLSNQSSQISFHVFHRRIGALIEG